MMNRTLVRTLCFLSACSPRFELEPRSMSEDMVLSVDLASGVGADSAPAFEDLGDAPVDMTPLPMSTSLKLKNCVFPQPIKSSGSLPSNYMSNDSGLPFLVNLASTEKCTKPGSGSFKGYYFQEVTCYVVLPMITAKNQLLQIKESYKLPTKAGELVAFSANSYGSVAIKVGTNTYRHTTSNPDLRDSDSGKLVKTQTNWSIPEPDLSNAQITFSISMNCYNNFFGDVIKNGVMWQVDEIAVTSSN